MPTSRRTLALLSVVVASSAMAPTSAQRPPAQPPISSRGVPIITVDGVRFRDLNRSGQLDPYEDWRRPVAQRVATWSGG